MNASTLDDLSEPWDTIMQALPLGGMMVKYAIKDTKTHESLQGTTVSIECNAGLYVLGDTNRTSITMECFENNTWSSYDVCSNGVETNEIITRHHYVL